jgi:hypothetical protein
MSLDIAIAGEGSEGGGARHWDKTSCKYKQRRGGGGGGGRSRRQDPHFGSELCEARHSLLSYWIKNICNVDY